MQILVFDLGAWLLCIILSRLEYFTILFCLHILSLLYSLEFFSVTSILFLSSFSRMYILFGLLVVVATNIPESSSLISHIQESNLRLYPLSHILPTLRRLWFKSSTNKTFSTFKFSLPRLTTPFWQRSHIQMQHFHFFFL